MVDSTKSTLSYKYRLYPNITQKRQLERIFDVACHVYNDIVNTEQIEYAAGDKWSWMSAGKLWRGERNKHPLIVELLPSHTVDDLVRRYDFNLKSFWTLQKNGHCDSRPPGSIPRHDFESVGYRAGGGVKLIEDRDHVARLYLYSVPGLIRVHYHRPIPTGWKIKYCTVTQTNRGEWYASFQCEGTPAHVAPDRAVGIDVGMYSLLALSHGTLTDNPRWYREGQQKRRVLQRQLARRIEGSQNWRDARQQIAKHEAKIARKREYWWHQITDMLTNNYGLIAIEDLNLDFMVQNKRLAISVHDAAFGVFWQQLEYKCKLRGVELVKVNPAYTSQICSGCGEIVKKDLSVRVHRCECGLEIDRDVNAARNILNIALNDRYSGQHGETWADTSSVPYDGQSPEYLASSDHCNLRRSFH